VTMGGGGAWGQRGATAAKQGRVGLTGGPCYSSGGGGLNTIQIQTNSNYFKTFQTLTDPKIAFPRPKNLK
jgi:hypothetical protein